MDKLTIRDIDVKDKRVLVRVEVDPIGWTGITLN